jgi:branched-chain amino acid transport system substrate-binding protein
MGINAPVLGGDVWDDAKIPQTLGTAINGTRFTVMANKVLPKTFVDNMEKNPRGKNVNAYSPRFYDAVYILADIMRRVGTDPTKIKEQLYKLNNFLGIAENYTMDKNGDLANSSYAIKEFLNGKIVEAHDASSPTNNN